MWCADHFECTDGLVQVRTIQGKDKQRKTILFPLCTHAQHIVLISWAMQAEHILVVGKIFANEVRLWCAERSRGIVLGHHHHSPQPRSVSLVAKLGTNKELLKFVNGTGRLLCALE